MKMPPPWSVIETDIRIVMALAADVCRNIIGLRHPSGRGDAAAAAFLGMETLDGVDGFIVEQTYDSFERHPNSEFLARIDITGTLFAEAARRCYDLVSNKGPIEHIRYDDDRDDGLHWLWYFLSAIPGDSYGTGALDYSGLRLDPDSNLRLLHDLTSARLTLAEYVDDLTRAEAGWEELRSSCVFTPRDISLLGDVNLRTVRNAMGPKGNKPIRTETIGGKASRPDLVWGDALDSLEWLAGRRGFQPGPLSPQFVDRRVPEIGSLRALAAVPGVVAWINRTTTDGLAAKLQWSPERIRSWTRGKDIDPEQAQAISTAAGLDGKAYASRIKSLLG
ncbi:hypothetical protein EN932_04175 [Mesorhizobium sp. M7A.F.Ca.US.002.01.1.1]|uniref:hypothetical protein n=1 Tax=Mesorhizobium sp. M7A.F.Ca.US.002.01.1.1 TaxID=2496700 RepID=UPI000FD26A5A|nr:hypothetical protein [Mesorhizobium sp. M7A.F.Ca.US.002.01.1.1]RVA14637.1 hypothetical protein EN932_04175 [Mesorhizobium sp. M7A.F.Ca.US.002.01.1.1]